MRLRQIRDGVELQPLFEDNNYDFNYQQPRMKRTGVKMMPGDEFVLECGLNSQSRGETTYCLTFVEYYPRSVQQLHSCMSWFKPWKALEPFGVQGVNISLPGKALVQNAEGVWQDLKEFVREKVRWDENDNVKTFQAAVRDGGQLEYCHSTRADGVLETRVSGDPDTGAAVRGTVVVRRSPELGATLKTVSVDNFTSHEGMPAVHTPWVAPGTCGTTTTLANLVLLGLAILLH